MYFHIVAKAYYYHIQLLQIFFYGCFNCLEKEIYKNGKIQKGFPQREREPKKKNIKASNLQTIISTCLFTNKSV